MGILTVRHSQSSPVRIFNIGCDEHLSKLDICRKDRTSKILPRRTVPTSLDTTASHIYSVSASSLRRQVVMLSVLSIKMRRFGDKVHLADELIPMFGIGTVTVSTYSERIISSSTNPL